MLNAREFQFSLYTCLPSLQIVTFGISSLVVSFLDFHTEAWLTRYEPLVKVSQSISNESWQQ